MARSLLHYLLPLAFDNAINKQAADEKGIISPVAGDADILLVPDIESYSCKTVDFFGARGRRGYCIGRTRPSHVI